MQRILALPMLVLLAGLALADAPVASPDQQIQEIQRRARREIQQIGSDPSPAAQRQVERIKYEAEVQILQIRLQQARRAGDQEAIQALQEALDRLQHPEAGWRTRPEAPRPDPSTPGPSPVRP